MTRTLDVRELVRLAVEDERSGVRLYEQLAAAATAPLLRDLFQRTGAQERVHQRRFEQMLERVQASQAEAYPDEYVDYLQALVAESGTTNQAGLQEAGACPTDADALELALRFERFQMQLLQDLAEVLGQADLAEVRAILTEEQAHVVALTSARQSLADA